ncbi:MAG TPA: SCP2 sterol-binding domain-containing protein [Deltaproteobacteria bacterium]|nr:SCP2 sterol-binding domain-containing protein [Deltaproteobacteria bacterium]
MADTHEFFSTVLPERLTNNPSLVQEIGAIYVFDIDGAGQWTVDLTGEGTISEGSVDNAGCTVSAAKADFESMLDNPSSAMMLFMANKLKVSDVPLGLSLQKLLS